MLKKKLIITNFKNKGFIIKIYPKTTRTNKNAVKKSDSAFEIIISDILRGEEAR